MNWNKTLFRCSSLGYIMTDGLTGGLTEKQEQTLATLKVKAKLTDKQQEEMDRLIEKRDAQPKLSKGVITHLADVYTARKWGRRNEISNKYLEKGTLVEEDSLTLYSLLKGAFFKKNSERLRNDFIEGTPDFFIGKMIKEAQRVKDIKSSWDALTFHRTIVKNLNDDYYWQMQGYMWLTDAEYADLCYCLVNTPTHIIDSEKRKLQWQMGVIDPTGNTAFLEGCKEIEKLAIYDIETFLRQNPGYDMAISYTEWKDMSYDVPAAERVYEIEIPRNQSDIDLIPERIEICRSWLREFEELRQGHLSLI